jgi:hypothetical protein
MEKKVRINVSPIVLGDDENVMSKKADHEDAKIEILDDVDLLVSKEIFSDFMTCAICSEL